MNEQPPQAEKERVEDIGQELQSAGDRLGAVDPSRLTAEQFHALESRVDIVIGVLAVYAGVEITRLGLGIAHGMPEDPSWAAVAERLARFIGTALVAMPGMLIAYEGIRKFLSGVERFARNTTEAKPESD